MKSNKMQKYAMNKLDKSYENNKYHYQKKSININNNFSKNIFSSSKKNSSNYTNFNNINNKKLNQNKKKNTNNEINYIDNNKNKLNIIRIQNNNNKSKLLKFQNSQMHRDCRTPDRNYNKLNLGLTTNKKENRNNPFLLKSNQKKNTSFIEYHFKNSSKRYLTRSKSKNNILINDRQKALTPDKANKIKNIKFNKNQINYNKYGENKKIKPSINLNQNLMFSKSFNLKNENSFTKIKEKDNIYAYNNYSINHNIYKNKNNVGNKRSKLPMLTNISRDKDKDRISRSFYSQKNSNNRMKNSVIARNESYLLSNLKLKKAEAELTRLYTNTNYSKNNSRSNSTDSNYNKKSVKNNYRQNSNIKKISKNNENSRLIINKSHENINKVYHKTYNNNMINNHLISNNNYYNYNDFSLSQNMYNNKFKVNINTIKNNNINKKANDNNLEYSKSNTKTFLEIAQQKLNQKKGYNQKNYKYVGANNFITKSSTNTNDDINSSNSIISKHNQLLDSIEEIHFNFVNVEQTSRNLMKLMENTEGDIIVNNNPNSTVIIVEERDIE